MDNAAEALQELLDAVRKLRSPGGCNWDRSQTLQSLRPYMLEEAYEVADAVDKGDYGELRKELGDLLLHIVMASEICREENRFDLAEVAGRITGKLRRRHPHVFQDNCDLTPQEVEKQWEAIKAREKKGEKKRFFDSLPDAMPALQKAWRIQQRSSEVGYPWPGVVEIRALLREKLDGEDEMGETDAGEMLFLLAGLFRQLKIEPEKALRSANSEFIDRFHRLEELLRERGVSLSDAGSETMEECIGIAFSRH